MFRRLRHEVNEASEKGEKWMLIEEKEVERATIYIEVDLCEPLNKIMNERGIDPFLMFRFTRFYPFEAPQVFLFDKSLKEIYATHLYNEFREMVTDKSCLCCSSILCRSNWGPILKINDILNEFYKFIGYKVRMVERIHCRKIQEKYIPQIPCEYYSIYSFL